MRKTILALLISSAIICATNNFMYDANAIIEQNSILDTLSDRVQKIENKEIKLIVKDKGLMRLEDIVLDGLIAEMGYPSFDIEAYKAQAVAIRTFAMSVKKHKNDNFDLCGTTCCFAMADDNKKSKFSPEQMDKFRQAVKDTKGEVITYQGEIIDTPVFFAYGHKLTNTPEDVWKNSDNKKYPYLQSVPTIEEIEPQKITYNVNDFLRLIDAKSLEDIEFKKINANGYVKEIIIGDKTYNGNQLREKLKIKSGNFTIENKNDIIEITCYGYGHGVGMSQYGANELAKKGYEYKDILKHYYQGTEIISYKSANIL